MGESVEAIGRKDGQSTGATGESWLASRFPGPLLWGEVGRLRTDQGFGTPLPPPSPTYGDLPQVLATGLENAQVTDTKRRRHWTGGESSMVWTNFRTDGRVPGLARATGTIKPTSHLFWAFPFGHTFALASVFGVGNSWFQYRE